MDIPYGFDCFAFQNDQIKYFESNLYKVKHSTFVSQMLPSDFKKANLEAPPSTTDGQADYVKFTRKNEDYPKEQLMALGKAGRLNMTEIDKKIFCGIKIQIGIGVVTNFLRKGLQYKTPIKGRSELINGSWTGIVQGLTVDKNSPISYDLAFGNFLAWDVEFPYIKFGPFLAIESKLVMLTGSSRRIETSSFGTNITGHIWFTIMSLLLILSLLSSLRIDWQQTKCKHFEEIINQLAEKYGPHNDKTLTVKDLRQIHNEDRKSLIQMLQDFFFIYFTMLLNKPSHEFDELIWPKQSHQCHSRRYRNYKNEQRDKIDNLPESKESLRKNYDTMMKQRMQCKRLPTSIRILSYLWSAACLVMVSIYSGEMLAVMLLHADQNIDTIVQLINSKPPIEPVIRQDDFTYTLMLRSLDENMLKLHSKTKVLPRAEVYTRQFIENVSARKYALLGDDELIETIYDIYHKYYPLYKSKMTYLQYPISIIYRKDLNVKLEKNLRRGLVQMFEMGLTHRWYQAQKETYIQFYDTYERKTQDIKDLTASNNSEQKYKPLSMHHFESFFRAMLYCSLFAFIVLILEIIHYKIKTNLGK